MDAGSVIYGINMNALEPPLVEESFEVEDLVAVDQTVAMTHRAFHWGASVVSGIVCALATGLLVVAAQLSPDPAGVGTHSQLGLASCGFLDRTGLPCATCGMTTSFALAADGQLFAAFLNQPAGAILAVITAIVALLAGYGMVRGVSLLPVLSSIWRPMTLIVLASVVMVAWVYKAIALQ